MIRYSCILTLALIQNTFAEIMWVEPTKFEKNEQIQCSKAIEFVAESKAENQKLVEQGIANWMGNFTFWVLDINGDQKKDYFVSAAIPGSCGTAGCSSKLFISTDTGCESYWSPHLQHADIGFENGNVFLGLKHRECRIWTLTGTKLTHKENIINCGG